MIKPSEKIIIIIMKSCDGGRKKQRKGVDEFWVAYSLQGRHSNGRDRWTSGWCRRDTVQHMGLRTVAVVLGWDLEIRELWDDPHDHLLDTFRGQIVEDTFLQHN